jgi:hypothetical protein
MAKLRDEGAPIFAFYSPHVKHKMVWWYKLAEPQARFPRHRQLE